VEWHSWVFTTSVLFQDRQLRFGDFLGRINHNEPSLLRCIGTATGHLQDIYRHLANGASMAKKKEGAYLIRIKTVRKLMDFQGMTEDKLADTAGISLKTVNRLLRGKGVYLSTIKRIATALNVNIEDLIYDRQSEDIPEIGSTNAANEDTIEKKNHLAAIVGPILNALGYHDKDITIEWRRGTINFMSLVLFVISISVSLSGHITIGLITSVMGMLLGGFGLFFARAVKASYATILAISMNMIVVATCGAVIIKERLNPPAPPAVVAAVDNRTAAEYALSISGTIRVKGSDKEITVAANLPSGPIQITHLNFRGNIRITDADLSHFPDCTSLLYLDLDGTKITDAGLRNFSNCAKLEYLGLFNTKVTDAGLANFKNCKDLMFIQLGKTQLTDAGMANFKDCKNLTTLSLGETKLANACLAYLTGCDNLKEIDLAGTQVNDTAMAHLKSKKKLEKIVLWGTKITPGGIADLQKALPKATIISIRPK
jgi:DNA-binding Xre family transcriptional regulator